MMRRWLTLLLVATVIGVLGVSAAAGQARLQRVLAFEEALKGTAEQELRWPVAVAAASAEEFAVADAFNSRLLIFGKVGVSWQLQRSTTLPATPVGLLHTGERYIVSLRGGHGLLALEGPKLLQRRIGLPRGVVPGPIAAGPGGSLLVYDYAGRNVLRMNSDGDPAGTVDVDGRVTALSASASGGFYAAVAEKSLVLRFDADGTEKSRWRVPGEGPVPAWPVGLAAEPGRGVVVVDRHGSRVLVLDDNGRPIGIGSRHGWEPGLLLFPSAITRLPDGRFLIADARNGRVQIFHRTDRGTAP